MQEDIEVVVIDIGNTTIKSAEVRDGQFSNQKYWKSTEDLLNFYSTEFLAISTVRDHVEKLKGQFQNPRILVLDPSLALPIRLAYDTIETLGIDRIALSVGANHLFPGQNNLVIDLGTCVTLDLVDDKGVFRGGTISPGLSMRMKAMAHYTSNLPDISNEWQKIPEQTLGQSTKTCLLNGSLKGLLYEINGTLETLKQDFASLNIILCGGDAQFFESRIKAHIFAGSKIVELGIYRIWKHQSNIS
ncbi:MAG: type III pantothenate kinase [Bacteroidota bacterium]